MNKEFWQQRLDGAIPGAAHTYSKGRDVFPLNAPSILTRGRGCYVWDSTRTKYLDFGMGLKSVVLGYADKSVDSAVRKATRLGNNLSRPSMTELLAAEELIQIVPCAEMVKFAKNGSNVTTAATKLSRVITQRKLIAVPKEQPFFSFDDWFIGVTNAPMGIPPEHASLTKTFSYGNIDSLRRLFEEYPNQIAAVMLEPAVDLLSCHQSHDQHDDNCLLERINATKAFLKLVQDECKSNSTVLIFDEMRTGFRWSLGGAQELFGVIPDLSTFGKAMANGYSVAALVGSRPLMEVAATNVPGTPRTFLLSSTHGAEIVSLEAFRRTHREIVQRDVISRLWNFGSTVERLLFDIIDSSGWSHFISISGPPVALNFEFQPSDIWTEQQIKTKFFSLLARERVLMSSFSQSAAHGSKEIRALCQAVSLILEEMARHSSDPLYFESERHLMKPVFRPYN